jgi:hypothetical protein
MTLARFVAVMTPLSLALDPDDLARQAFEVLDSAQRGFLVRADLERAARQVGLDSNRPIY